MIPFVGGWTSEWRCVFLFSLTNKKREENCRVMILMCRRLLDTKLGRFVNSLGSRPAIVCGGPPLNVGEFSKSHKNKRGQKKSETALLQWLEPFTCNSYRKWIIEIKIAIESNEHNENVPMLLKENIERIKKKRPEKKGFTRLRSFGEQKSLNRLLHGSSEEQKTNKILKKGGFFSLLNCIVVLGISQKGCQNFRAVVVGGLFTSCWSCQSFSIPFQRLVLCVEKQFYL